MKKAAWFAVLSVGVAACSDLSNPVTPSLKAPLGISAAQQSAEGAIPGQYIVVFRDNVADAASLARQLAAAHGASIRFIYQSAIKGFAAQMSDAAAAALANNPTVAYVEQDQVVHAITDELMDANGDPWGLDRIDAASGLNAKYSYTLTGSGVTAYIIDTGIRTTHGEFGGRASSGYDAVDGGAADDCNGHGTHVSGTVGGTTYGVAKAVSLVAVRVLDCNGSGSWAGVIAGVDWVTANHTARAVANMSLGGGAASSVDQAITNSIAAGVSYAVAAGNGNSAGVGQDACNYSPARVPNAMTIGATGKTDAKTSWSNYGSCVDWFAPGSEIKSAWNSSDIATNTISGTSMATPHTTGVAALYLQANPSATPQQVRDGLYAATTKGVVTSSSTANNHLLYSPPAGFGGGGGGGGGGNVLPTANFTYSCTYLSCSFTDNSTDTDGTISSRSWTFGDGSSSSATNPSHSYASANTYTVTLLVTDNVGGTNSKSTSVTVTAAPAAATLSVTGSKLRGTWTTNLTWSGFAGTVTSVDIYRNGVVVSTLSNTGSYSESGKFGGAPTYQVCAAGSTSTCSNTATVSP